MITREQLLKELRDGADCGDDLSDAEVLRFCNISDGQLRADCETKRVPELVIGLAYYCHGMRAARARALGHEPDRSIWGA